MNESHPKSLLPISEPLNQEQITQNLKANRPPGERRRISINLTIFLGVLVLIFMSLATDEALRQKRPAQRHHLGYKSPEKSQRHRNSPHLSP